MHQISDTLGDLGDGHRLYARCEPYGRNLPVDIGVPVARLGPDYPVTKAMRKIVCGVCRHHATTWRGYAGNHGVGWTEPPAF